MKIVFLICSLIFTISVFGQEVQQNKDSIAKSLTPIGGKAIVYIVRPTGFGFLIRMKLYCDSIFIGSTMAQNYVYLAVDSGKHIFISKSENKSKLELLVEPGKIYYLKQQVKMGFLYAETSLKLLDEAEGKKYLNKCTLSSDNSFIQ